MLETTARGRFPASDPLASAALAALVALSGCFGGSDAASASDYRGTLLPAPREKIDFTLTDTDGTPFSFREATEGYVTLVFFGYTHCPDVCPIHMANLAAVLRDLSFELRRQFKVIFITTDPDRDTPERLERWLSDIDPTFIGLRGPIEEVNEIAVGLGLPGSVKQSDEAGSDYLIGHSAQVIAFTRDNLAHVTYPFGTRQADWAHDLPKLAAEKWGER